MPLAVCSRVADYEALTQSCGFRARLWFSRSRRSKSIISERAGKSLAGVRTALRDDPALRELLDTPLMLSIVALAYAEKSAAEVQATEERR